MIPVLLAVLPGAVLSLAAGHPSPPLPPLSPPAPLPAFSQEPGRPAVENRLEAEQMYLGESMAYEVRVTGVANPPLPQLTPPPGISIDFVSDSVQNSSFTLRVNGQLQARSSFGHVYLYRLSAAHTGVFNLPGAVVEGPDGELRGTPLRLRVYEPEDQDLVKVELGSNRRTVYPLQPFVVTLDVLVRALPTEAGGPRLEPLDVLRRAPQMVVPWVEPPAGLTADSLERWLQPLLNRRGTGFTINDIAAGDGLFLFDRSAGTFLPPAAWVSRAVDGVAVDYRRYRLQRTFTPLEPGRYRFEPAHVKGTFAATIEDGRLIGEALFAVSDALEIEVLPVPSAGRPAAYTGAIGSAFTLAADLSPVSGRTGDPLTLTLTVSGRGPLEDVGAPDLATAPGLEDDFKIYDATTRTENGRRVFTYGLRAMRAGVEVFPAVPFAWFDPEAEAFRETASAPIPVSIAAGATLEAGDVAAAPTRSRAIEAAEGGYFANWSDPARLVERPLTMARLGMLSGALALAYALVAGFVGRRRRLRADPQRLRARGAESRAQQRLAKACGALETGQLAAGMEGVHGAFAGWVADRAGRPEEGLTPGELAALARQLGLSEDGCERLQALLEEGEGARFGGQAGAEGAALAAEARALADDLRAALREQGQTAPAARALALALMLCGATAGCRGPADPELAAAVEGLEADFLAASTPAEFRAVAERFEARLASAPPSGPLLFNLGNAWARAGERARAVAAYRQAKLWLPRDPHLDHNLRVALDGAPALEQRGGVMTKIAFWSTLISANELAWITAVLAVFAFASALLALAVRHPAAGMVRNGALVLFLAIGLAFLWLRREQAPGHFGVIASDAVEARTGNAASYEPAFTEPLRVATEFEVLDQRGGWIRLRLPGGAEGWVPDAAARVY